MSEQSLQRSGWRVLQLRSLLSNNLAAVTVGLLLVVAIAGLFTYNTHVDPGTEVETVQESQWSSTAVYSHQAEVRQGTDVFEQGTVLREQSAYIEMIAPVLDGTFRYEYAASNGGDLRTDVEVVLVSRSVSEDGFEFWRENRTLATQSEDGLQPGESVTASFSINVTELRQRIDDIEEQLGTTPGSPEVTVESRVQITGERNGRSVDQQRTYTMDVVPGDGIYNVENDDPAQQSGEQFREETTTATYGPLRSGLAPLLLAVALVAGLALAGAAYRDTLALSEAEHAWLSYCQDRAEFTEWISTGTLAEETLPDRRVELDSLGGLVDVGIDSNRRVVADDDRGLFAVLVEDVAYVYEPPDSPSGDGDPLSLTGGLTATGLGTDGESGDADEAEAGEAETEDTASADE